LPILRTKKALADMATGTLLQVIATDPGTPTDMAAFCQQTGNLLRESARQEDKFVFVIQRK
jgi:tRNA 2-thiouridine synthesizing protein A